jgi:hypothetical protein
MTNSFCISFLVEMQDLTCSCFVSGDLPIIISCASLALADAGIMMYDLVTSVSVVCHPCCFCSMILAPKPSVIS